MVSKKKTPIKRHKSPTKRYRGIKMTGHPAEKCEVCHKQAKHGIKIDVFEVLFCPKHYKMWNEGYSIEQMRELDRGGRSRKTTTRRRVEVPIMKCGHRANAVDQFGRPHCAICYPSQNATTIDPNPQSFTGRMAKCSHCKNMKPSSYILPFFNPMPNREYDDYYCGCRGWD